ncbi:Arginine-glutamic acid dipeptide repeats protein-like isoform X2 [Oopsacas minuta]|uniref:Arginine-glutamic acid dipeptide repeats protein-like isoform X2 n=1 Tax=Oopsacas minuta TaxID=111878 RepID=A0AAV7K3E9_9METZ|nr:Arginine-glutamic acid dipeptide repeats protein-like isoform X2 [Oopsacas minuta]
MSGVDTGKSKKGRLKRQLPQRTKYNQTIEEKTFGIVSDDSLRSGLRTTKTRGRRAGSKKSVKLKYPHIPANIPSIRHGVIPTKQNYFEKDVYVGEDNQEYHIGDSVYIQSDTLSSVYFIGQIRDFRTTRKEERLVEIQWYYRPSEVPASVLDSLLQDRIIQSKNHEETICSLLNDPHVRTRELFRCGSNGENFNLTSTSLIKGKCYVVSLSDIINLREYTLGEDHFFCILGFDPITRRLSDFKGEIRVGPSHQVIYFIFPNSYVYVHMNTTPTHSNTDPGVSQCGGLLSELLYWRKSNT